MKISLIENGLDSLTKGYDSLKKYDRRSMDSASDKERFMTLKAAILSIQHGIEILFKVILVRENEILLYSEINSRLKGAYKKKRNGEIAEIFEDIDVHTVTFKESIERVNDICGIDVSEGLKKKLLRLEKWRNSVTHSAVALNESEIAGALSSLMPELDKFFGPALGNEYLDGQGKLGLDRAYAYFSRLAESKVSPLKAKVIERLIRALKENAVEGVTSPGLFHVKNLEIAREILREMQGADIVYGFDMANLHCSGKSSIIGVEDELLCILGEDNNAEYLVNFSDAVIYVPPIQGRFSPLIFIFGKPLAPIHSDPWLSSFNGVTTQQGYRLADGQELWGADECNEFASNDEDRREYVSIFRFLTPGCICFLNIQTLSYGNAKNILYSDKYISAGQLFEDIQNSLNSAP